MMLDWINPGALVALAAVAGPVLVHLLQRRRSRTVPFPSLRFFHTTRAAALRIVSPSDAALLALRVAIVAAAALAWSQPLFLTGPGREARERRISRAVIRDTSPSAASSSAAFRAAAVAERQGAIAAVEIEHGDLRAALRDAVRWLERTPLSGREIVVQSDFQLGALDGADVAGVPRDIGIRFVPATDGPPAHVAFPGGQAFGAAGVPATAQHVELDGPRTRMTVRPTGEAPPLPTFFAADSSTLDVEALVRTVAIAGAPATPRDRSIGLAFANGKLPADLVTPREAWMLGAVLVMRGDLALRQHAALRPRIESGTPTAEWLPIASGSDGRTRVDAAARGAQLVVRVDAAPDEYLSALALRALLDGAADRPRWSEHEIERIPSGQLRSWSRPPGAIPVERWKTASPGDARALWATVLALFALEAAVRRRRTRITADRTDREAVHAA